MRDNGSYVINDDIDESGVATGVCADSSAEDGPFSGDAGGALSTTLMVGIGVVCAAAAVVIGYYAIWLARQRAARQTLTDVQDILNLCRDRMRQMEADISHLPRAAVGSR